MTLKGSELLVLNGQRIKIVTESSRKPRWIPMFAWKWMVRQVVKTQRVTTERG